MVSINKSIWVTGCILSVLILTVLNACVGSRQDLHRHTRLEYGTGDIVLQTFDRTRADVMEQVRNGTLPEDAAERADELAIELQKYLIRTEADSEMLKLDVLHAPAAEREASLEKLMDLSAEREREKVKYLRRLQNLLAKADSAAAPAASFSGTQMSAPAAHEEDRETGQRTRDSNIEIEIAPEDISTGERP